MPMKRFKYNMDISMKKRDNWPYLTLSQVNIGLLPNHEDIPAISHGKCGFFWHNQVAAIGKGTKSIMVLVFFLDAELYSGSRAAIATTSGLIAGKIFYKIDCHCFSSKCFELLLYFTGKSQWGHCIPHSVLIIKLSVRASSIRFNLHL